jgi:hypothetical protein
MNESDRLNRIYEAWPKVFRDGSDALFPAGCDRRGHLTVICSSDEVAAKVASQEAELINKLADLLPSEISVNSISPLSGFAAQRWMLQRLHEIERQIADLQ